MKFTEIPYDILKSFFLDSPGMSVPAPAEPYVLYTITSSVLSGSGIIETSGISYVLENGSANYTFTPISGWEIGNVIVDGISVGAVSSYLFMNVSSNHTISVSFTILPEAVVWGIGGHFDGQLGFGSYWIYNLTEITDINEDSLLSMDAGMRHFMIIKSDGSLWGTGISEENCMNLIGGEYYPFLTRIGSDNDWKEIMCGHSFTFAKKTDGSIWSIGRNDLGQLGLGNLDSVDTFTQVSSADEWDIISVGIDHVIALKKDGTIWSCGNNTDGRLGTGNYTQKTTFTQEATSASNWTKISTMGYDTYAIKSDRTLWATGSNTVGQLGIGSTTPTKVNVFTQTGNNTSDWVDVFAGYACVFALKIDGTLWATGYNTLYQLGLGDTTNRSSFTQVGTDTNWLKVTLSWDAATQTIALKTDGTLWSCGFSYFGSLGLGELVEQVYTLTQIGTESNWTNIICGDDTTYAYTSNNKLYSCGNGETGSLAIKYPNNDDVYVSSEYMGEITGFVPMGYDASINRAVGGGDGSTFLLDNDGYIYGVGMNYYGQLGIGNNDYYVWDWTKVGTDKWIDMAGAYYWTVGIKQDGTLWTAGSSWYNYMGFGTSLPDDDYNTFTQIGSDTDWMYVEASPCGESTYALKQNGILWSCGGNWEGQLGLGHNNDNVSTFTEVSAGPFVQVSIADNHGLGLKADGTIWSTGDNWVGGCGLGESIKTVYEFTQIGTDNDWVYISSSGYAHSLAIKSNGTLWGTGDNSSGELGLGDNIDRYEFTQIGTDTDWLECIAAPYHTYAIKNNGDLYVCGWAWSTGWSMEDILPLTYIGSGWAPFKFGFGYEHLVAIKTPSITYTITSSTSENGTISPLGNTDVVEHGWCYFEITPSAGYSVADVIVDGVSQGAMNVYLFSNITLDHTISVTFSELWEDWVGSTITETHPWTSGGFYGGADPPVVSSSVLTLSAAATDGDHDLTYESINDTPANRPTGLVFKYKGTVTIIQESALTGKKYYQDDTILISIWDSAFTQVYFYPYAHSEDNPYGGEVYFDHCAGEEITHNLAASGLIDIAGITVEVNKIYLSGGEMKFELEYITFESLEEA